MSGAGRIATIADMPSRAASHVPRDTPSRLREGDIRFAGYASVFDRVDRGGDVVRRGAFVASLAAGRVVPLLWQHRAGAVIGTIETLAEDRRGLRVVARVTHPTAASLVARGALTGLSFGYRVTAARGSHPRELLGLDLAEVSLVAAPMQALARIIATEIVAAGNRPSPNPSRLREGSLLVKE